jgi:hypothetical protein
MPFRHSPRLLVAAAAIACAASAPASAHAATSSCRTTSTASGNRVLVATKQAVVFSSRRLKQDAACTYSDNRIVKLGTIACCSDLRYALGGRYLAYAYRLDEADNEVDEMGVVNLRTGGRVKHKGESAATTVDTNGFIRSFYVTPKGTLAWLQEFAATDEQPATGDLTVRAIAPLGKVQDLDTGKIAADSLALSSGGTRLYWTKDGAVQSAAL